MSRPSPFEKRIIHLERMRAGLPADDGEPLGLARLLQRTRDSEARMSPGSEVTAEEAGWMRDHHLEIDAAFPWRPFTTMADMLAFARERLHYAREQMQSAAGRTKGRA